LCAGKIIVVARRPMSVVLGNGVVDRTEGIGMCPVKAERFSVSRKSIEERQEGL
jgi:hypothetical protein